MEVYPLNTNSDREYESTQKKGGKRPNNWSDLWLRKTGRRGAQSIYRQERIPTHTHSPTIIAIHNTLLLLLCCRTLRLFSFTVAV